ncbi:MAG TPA: ATP-binding protein [Anaerolineae bacterium]|nr:ATP-binding protein [Anaerolineae bacterium]
MTVEKPTSQLLQILQSVSPAQRVLRARRSDRRLADAIRFPFLALVGQAEMKIALILALINPGIGGVLLLGPRGTGKTTAVRGLVDLLPQVPRSTCVNGNGCEPEAAYTLGLDAVCPDCAARLGRGESLTAPDRMRLIELPLNARLEDVVGGINERVALEQNKVRVEPGILSTADQNLLYIDEVNLLDAAVADAILDSAAQGQYTVRRGPLAATYRARLVLVGSMNPEEGRLRPQIQDRFGLRVLVRGLSDPADRLEIYHRVREFRTKPHALVAAWLEETLTVAEEIAAARALLPDVTLAPAVEQLGLRWVRRLGIDSHRAEVTLFEAARARAAADNRRETTQADLITVAPLALRQRRSPFITDFFARQGEEDDEIARIIHSTRRASNARATNGRRAARRK